MYELYEDWGKNVPKGTGACVVLEAAPALAALLAAVIAEAHVVGRIAESHGPKNIAMTGHFVLAPPFFVSNKFMKKLSPELKATLQMSADIAAAAARAHTLAGLAGVKIKLEAAGVKFTYPDKTPFIAAAAKVHAAFAEKRGESYVKLIKAINEAAK